MPDPGRVSLPAHDVPRRPAGATAPGAGSRPRPIDTLLADRGQLFQALFLSAPIAKALVDLDGHILVANPIMCALTGRTAEDLTGRHVDLLAHPDDPPVTDLLVPEAADDEPDMDPNLLLDGERRLRHRDGHELWVVQSHEVVRHTTGAAQFVVLSFVDVTDRRRAAEDVEDLDGLRALADRLLAVLDEAFVVNGREIVLSASVGLTLGADMTPDDLLRQAQSALSKAKADGQRARIEVHDGALSRNDVDQLQLETDLRHAIDNGELRLFYQPIVHLADETLLGYEALIRWQHPTRGLLPPGAFLDAAENNRLTSKLGEWVIRQACTDAAGWPAGLRVHVNISARHLAEDGFSELVQSALEESGLAPDRLELEITESTALFAAEATLYAVSQVTEAGVTLALDDFGTGYSAITALHRLPIHTVKIDRSFVADVVTEPSTAALVHGLLQLGRGMGLQVIAEGIEDLDQADWLLRHGCAMAQGYAFGRPAPLPNRTEALLEEIIDAPVVEMSEETPETVADGLELPPGALRRADTDPELIFPVQRT